MSEVASTFVRRHRLVEVNRTKGLVLMVLADVADENGRARMTQAMVVTDIGSTLSTIKKAFQSLQRECFLIKGGGRTYVIVGIAEHNIMSCVHVECAAEAESIRGGGVSARKRALAAARARKAREKRKAAQTA